MAAARGGDGVRRERRHAALELFKAAADVAQRIGSMPPATATSASASPPPSASGPSPATQASAVPPASGPMANGPQVGVVHARQAPPPRRPNASFKQTATLMSPGAQSAPAQQPPPPPPPPSSRGGAVPPAPGSDPGRPPPLYAREPRSVQPPPRSGEGPSSASSARVPPAPASNRGMPEPFAPASPRQGQGYAHSYAAPTQHGGAAGGAQPSTSPYGGGTGSGHPPGQAHGTQQFGTHAQAGHPQSGPPQSGHPQSGHSQSAPPQSSPPHSGLPHSAHPQSAAGHGAQPHSARGGFHGTAGSHGTRPRDAHGQGTPSLAASTLAAPLPPLIDDDSDDEQLAEMAQARTPIGGIAAVPHDARIAMRGRRYDEEVTIRRDLSSLGIRFEDLDEETHIVSGTPQQLGRVVVAVERFQPEEPPPSSAPPSSERRHASAAPISVSGLRAYDDIRDEPEAARRRAIADAQRGARASSSRAGQPLEGLRATHPLEMATVPALRVAVLGTADQGDVQLVLLPHGSLAPEGAATALLLPASAADAAAIARLFEPPSDDD
ncbi:MAG: hypothetical protein WKG00_03770 [Polyangiaceae bacterium]